MTLEYLERPVPGWFVLDVMREKWRKWDWVALMIDVEPDELKNCICDVRERWVRIQGKHRNRDAACDALEEMMATRH